jgi:peptidoglycan hydrolase-like protein with peptidoglycan-binding domain
MGTEITHRVVPKHAKAERQDLSRLAGAVKDAGQISPGESGPAVSALQRQLRGLNLYAGPIDGHYDASTEAAVRQLEAQAGVASPDGTFDGQELKEVRSREKFVEKGLKTPARLGQKGGDIAQLEYKLQHLGYQPGKLDGVYDGQLEKAVRAYRKDDKHVPNAPHGVAGENVLKGLNGQIHTVEANLKKLGRKPGTVDGRYTAKTARAVRSFQKKHHLKVTGNANARTRAVLAKEARQGISDKTKRFIQIAKAQVGKPYVFGAEGPNAFDCSGLIDYALNHAGAKVPRLTADGYMQMWKSSRVSRKNLKPGDIVFYHYPNTRHIAVGHASHIEIYLGHGMTMGTDNPSEGARIEPIDWSAFIGGARVPGLQH